MLCADRDFHFKLIRLTSSGTKDSTFGSNGFAEVNFASTGLPTSNGTVKALALQSNDKILVAGNLCNGSNNTNIVGLARLTVDGDLDTSFSGDGLWFFLGGSEVSDMVVQSSDGKILLAGRMLDSTGTYWKSALWRFNTNGTPTGASARTDICTLRFGRGLRRMAACAKVSSRFMCNPMARSSC